MEATRGFIKTTQLRTGVLSQLLSEDNITAHTHYDTYADEFVLFFTQASDVDEIVGHPLDDNVSLLYRYADKEIVGIALEAISYDLRQGIPNATADWRMSQYGLRLANGGDIRLRVKPIDDKGNFTGDVRVYDAENREQQVILLQAA